MEILLATRYQEYYVPILTFIDEAIAGINPYTPLNYTSL